MALGKRQDEKQQDLFVATTNMPKSPGHPFYKRVNDLLKEAGFDEWAEQLVAVANQPEDPGIGDPSPFTLTPW